MAQCAIFLDGVSDADTDMDDKNSPNVFKCVPFLSGYGCADTDTQRWNSGLRLFFFLILCHKYCKALTFDIHVHGNFPLMLWYAFAY